MGNFQENVINDVKWIGRCICKVVRWFFEVLEKISRIVEDFLFSIEEILTEADDPRTLGEAAGIKKEIQCLEKEYDKRKDKMTQKDKNTLDELFRKPDYY